MNPTIHQVRNVKPTPSYYMVTFDTLADRTRWCLHHGFVFEPTEMYGARWTSTHNGNDFTRWLEMVPYSNDLAHNPRSLCLKVFLHDYNKTIKPKPTITRLADELTFRPTDASRTSEIKVDSSSNI